MVETRSRLTRLDRYRTGLGDAKYQFQAETEARTTNRKWIQSASRLQPSLAHFFQVLPDFTEADFTDSHFRELCWLWVFNSTPTHLCLLVFLRCTQEPSFYRIVPRVTFSVIDIILDITGHFPATRKILQLRICCLWPGDIFRVFLLLPDTNVEDDRSQGNRRNDRGTFRDCRDHRLPIKRIGK